MDLEGARSQYQKAAEAGHPEAMNEYGVALAEGVGGRQDPIEGAGWIYAAVALGAPPLAARNALALAQNMTAEEIAAARKYGRALLRAFRKRK
jgi:uncharacterized protein